MVLEAVILAAGKGVRLQPITHTRPKPLVPVLDKPLLVHTLEKLGRIGVDRVYIVVSYMAGKVEEALRGVPGSIPKVSLINQAEERGTGHALMMVEGIVKDDFLLVYGDLMVSESLLRRVAEAGGNVVAGIRVPNPWDYGVLVLGPGGELKGIVEKPEKGSEPSNLVNAGVYRFTLDIFHYLDKIGISPRGEIELTDAVTLMAGKDGVRVVEASRDEVMEVGKPWDLLRANRYALDNMLKPGIDGEVEEGARIKGRVYVAPGARVLAGAYIVGPAYIGENAVVGPNSYVRPYTVIGRGSRIGASVEVKDSILMEGVHASHLSYIGDSVICEHVNLGAGTITANLRFDDESVRVYVKGVRIDTGLRKLGAFIGGYVKTGVNVSIMPGVKIGAYSWIAPGAVVSRDIPPRSFYKWSGVGYVVEPLRLDGEKRNH